MTCGSVIGTNVSEEPAVSIFRVEESRSQKTVISISTAARPSNFTLHFVVDPWVVKYHSIKTNASNYADVMTNFPANVKYHHALSKAI